VRVSVRVRASFRVRVSEFCSLFTGPEMCSGGVSVNTTSAPSAPSSPSAENTTSAVFL